LSAATPPASGTITIETADAGPDLATSMQTFINAVGDAFSARGFTLLEEPGHSAFVVEMGVRRDEVGTGSARIAVGSAQMVGAGVRIPLSGGKSAIVPLQRTRLEIRIHKRGEQDVAWQGAAVTVRAAGTAKGEDKRVASDLASALLRAYPAQPENVIGVP
jgi:hypothetical protein